jgi:phenylalanyl-tRNA synthetase beta chain
VKFTLSWLREHLDTEAPAAEIADRLTMVGLELEELVDRASGLGGFVVGRVVAARPHPNADKLKVCTVDIGSGLVDVVCGAPNARAGLNGVFAAVGAFIPGSNLVLKKAQIRGVESTGMLLSERELGLSDEHAGIVELPDDVLPGAPAAEVMGLADPLIDVAITPNRGDCLGVRGIARDLAAAGMGTLKPLAVDPVPPRFPCPIGVVLSFDAATADACPYFVGRAIRGMRNGESPEWLKRRLLSVGLRPISALVDITNYMTIDLGRPLHAFDAGKLRGDLDVRLARPGERLLALNGREYDLGAEMTVIADADGPEALGGVIGGERTACTPETTDVFLEVALFDPVRTATTGRSLGIASDARYRFERGIDPSFLVDGMEIATRLVLQLCGGEPSDLVFAGGEPVWQRTIALRWERIRALGGVDVDRATAAAILSSLGFGGAFEGDVWQVTVPPWRNDVSDEACLVEEVLRIHGYEHIPIVPLRRETALPQVALAPEQKRSSLARRLLAGRGLVEAVSLSFMTAEHAEPFGGTPPSLRLINPISSDLDVMRPSILPNLIAACARNAHRGLPDSALFEVGPQYRGSTPSDQQAVAAGVRSGRTAPRHWAQPIRPVDAFDVKADALAVLAGLEAPMDALQVSAGAPEWYHPGRSGTIRLGPSTVLATFGEIHPRLLRKMDHSAALAAFEVFLDAVPVRKARPIGSRPPLRLSPFQPVERDFAFVMDEHVPAARAIEAARGADPALIADVRVFDVFAGESLGAGRKSLAITVTIQPTERTLTEPDLEALSTRISQRVEAATGGTLRA